MTIDLAAFDSDHASQAVMEIRHPVTDKPLGATLTLAGIDSETYREVFTRVQRRNVDRIRRNKKDINSQEDALEILMECTLGWDNVVLDGKKLTCNPKNKRLLYERLPWLKDQATEFLNERENYFRDSDGDVESADRASSDARPAAQ